MDLAYLIEWVGVWEYGAGLDEDGELPEWGIEAIDHPSALVGLAGEEVITETDRQVNAVPEIISLLVRSRLLVYRCDE